MPLLLAPRGRTRLGILTDLDHLDADDVRAKLGRERRVRRGGAPVQAWSAGNHSRRGVLDLLVSASGACGSTGPAGAAAMLAARGHRDPQGERGPQGAPVAAAGVRSGPQQADAGQ
jgi:hypothetical protein